MFRERLIGWTITAISLLAGVGYAYHYCSESFAALFIPVLLFLIYLLHVRASVKQTLTQATESIPPTIHHISGIDLKQLLEHKESLNHIIRVIDSIGNENTQDESTLYIKGEAGTAITSLRSKLRELKETERQRIWEAQGITSISEIRKNDTDLEGYATLVITHLVKYLNANQATFFSLNDEGQLELLATYAYGKSHKKEKVILESGAGLAGQCAIEREMMVLTNVPVNYLKITSGLGEATPGCIVIAPLLFREEVFGVVEIAAFEKFEQYQLDFLTKVCESIGLELFNIRSQERTRKIMEQSQEEELRRNLEEMKATQRQMVIKEEQLSQQLINTQRAMAMAEAERKKNEAILEGCMDAVVSFNQQGTIEYFNKAAEDVFGINREYIVGAHVSAILNIHIEARDEDSIRIVSATGAEVSLRTEVAAVDQAGDEISLLLTATKVKMDKAYLFTLFAQKVSVELF